MCLVFTEDMALSVIYVFPFFKPFGTCHRSESKMVSIDKPIPSSVSRGHDAVQRETRRQRVKRHMRVHTVAEPSNIQQKVHRIRFRLCADFVTSVGSKEAFSVQWDARVCIRRPSCLSVVRRIPKTSHPVKETTG